MDEGRLLDMHPWGSVLPWSFHAVAPALLSDCCDKSCSMPPHCLFHGLISESDQKNLSKMVSSEYLSTVSIASMHQLHISAYILCKYGICILNQILKSYFISFFSSIMLLCLHKKPCIHWKSNHVVALFFVFWCRSLNQAMIASRHLLPVWIQEKGKKREWIHF